MNVNDAEMTLIDMSLPFQPVGTWTHAGVVARARLGPPAP
jgi:hypothetical protein